MPLLREAQKKSSFLYPTFAVLIKYDFCLIKSSQVGVIKIVTCVIEVEMTMT